MILIAIMAGTPTVPKWMKEWSYEDGDLLDLLHSSVEEKAIAVPLKMSQISILRDLSKHAAMEVIVIESEDSPISIQFNMETSGLQKFDSVSALTEYVLALELPLDIESEAAEVVKQSEEKQPARRPKFSKRKRAEIEANVFEQGEDKEGEATDED